MLYRAPTQIFRDQSIRFITDYRQRIAQHQRDISSGVSLHRSSESPVEFQKVTSLSVQINQLELEQQARAGIEAKLNTSVTQLQEANGLMTRAKTLAQQGIQAFDAGEREALAVEVDGLLDSLQQIAKAKFAGAHLYSGVKSDQPPFEFRDPSVAGGTLVTDYLGGEIPGRGLVGSALGVEVLYVGEDVFSNAQRQSLVVGGTTGLQAGAGTDSLVGRANVLVSHTSTQYAAGSGIQPGASSVNQDTLLGDWGTHQLTLVDQSGTGNFGTVQLNDGDPINWTLSDNDLEITDALGRRLWVDTSSITPGFNGTVDLQSEGTLSVDGGATTVPIDFSDSQWLTDSTSGGQTHLDSRQVEQTGIAHLEFPGTTNAFQALYELSLDLRNARSQDSEGYAAALDRRIADLDRLSDHLLETVGRQSATLQTLSQLGDRMANLQLEAETQLSNLAATDVPATVLQLQNDQSLLEYTYSVTAAINTTSIIDFLT